LTSDDPLSLPGIPGSGPGLSGIPGVGISAETSVPVVAVTGMPGSGPDPGAPRDPADRRRTRGLWIELVVAVSLVVTLGLLAIGFIGTAADAHAHAGTTRVGQAIGAVICLGLLVLCTRWAVRTEHRLRRGQPVAQAFTSAHVDVTPARTAGSAARSARRLPARRRRYGPVSTAVVLLLFVGGVIGCIAGAISSHSQAVRSSFVQHHGTEATGTVDSVDNAQHCSKNGCDYTAAIVVALSPPVDGARTTVAHYPDFSDLTSGERVDVLVDPKQPGYAELPGSAFKSSWEWVVLVVIAVLFAGLAVLDAVALRKLLAHRRAARGGEVGLPSS
jgi:hypothetical protein